METVAAAHVEIPINAGRDVHVGALALGTEGKRLSRDASFDGSMFGGLMCLA